jgi:methionine-rich copper-binding protein CopC
MHHRRPLGALAAIALLLALAAPVAAHEELVASEPAAGATLETPPTEVVLTFSGELAPESGFVVLDPAGEEVGTGELDLDVAERNILRGDVVIADDGTYTVSWTAVAADEHPEEGTYTFVVGAAAEQPNTALARPSPALPAGLALLMLAVVTGLVRPLRVRAR